MAERRKAIPQKIRFEVFKRDSFTCQYCGRKAPDVVLEVDHITPVCKGGKNEIINLVTSCFDCNRGKGKRLISDDSAVSVQRVELELMEERRKQIEMIKRWRDELRSEIEAEVAYIVEIFENESGFEIAEAGKKDIRRWIHEFDFQILCDAVDIACFQYVKYGDRKSSENAFRKIGGICYNIKNGKRW